MSRLIVFVVVLFLSVFISAQDEPLDRWYVTIERSGEIRMFSLGGDVRSIGQIGERRFIDGLSRVDDRTLLGFVEVGDSDLYELYRLTPEGMDAFNWQEAVTWDTVGRPVAFAYPYVVMLPVRPIPETDVVIANVETLELSKTDYIVQGFAQLGCCRFSDDGQKLRYAGLEAIGEDNYTMRLVERDMTTGSEQIFYERTDLPRPLTYYPSTDGSVWLEHLLTGEPPRSTYSLIRLDESSEVIYDELFDDPNLQKYMLYFDTLWSYNPRCETNCLLTQYDLGSGQAIRFQMGTVDLGQAWVLTEDRILIASGREVAVLSPYDAPQMLGERDAQNVFGDQVAYDGSMFLGMQEVDAGRQYNLYNTQRGRVVHTVTLSEYFIIGSSFEGGFVMASTAGDHLDVYLSSTQAVVQLEGINVVDVLPDGRILYGKLERADSGPIIEMHLFNPADETSTLLLETFYPMNRPSIAFILGNR